jgi:hypothetical protein
MGRWEFPNSSLASPSLGRYSTISHNLLSIFFLSVNNVSDFTYWQVEKQSAHFYSVDITDKEAKMGLVCRVQSTAKSKFKVSC